jgi:hypothetical protein
MRQMMLAIEKHLSKFAKYCGYRVQGERGLDPIAELKKAVIAETNGAVPLADCLLYDYFDDISGIAFNKGSLGFMFEINSLIGSEEALEKNLTLFFNEEIPEGGYLQFLVIASNNIKPVLDKWQKGRTCGGSELKRLTSYRRRFIEDCAKDYANAIDGRLARNFRQFISFSCPGNADLDLETILKFKRKLQNKLKAENFNPNLCNAKDLIEVARDILQMSLKERDNSNYDILKDINSQIIKSNDSTICEDKIIHHDSGLVSKVFTPTELPARFSLAEMINLIGSEYKAIPARFIICYIANLGRFLPLPLLLHHENL